MLLFDEFDVPAEAGPDPISQAGSEHLLQESGVRVVIRELQNTPRLLQDWDLIEPADGAIRFRVELLRRWLEEHKPPGRGCNGRNGKVYSESRARCRKASPRSIKAPTKAQTTAAR